MASQAETDSLYMGIALSHAKLSKGKRLQVGACLVLESSVMIGGVNGLPRLLGNELEYIDAAGNLVTKLETIHAEQACLNKACNEGLSTKFSTMYVTHSCCAHCSSNMIACGIKELVYLEEYRDVTPLDMLRSCGIIVRKYLEKETND